MQPQRELLQLGYTLAFSYLEQPLGAEWPKTSRTPPLEAPIPHESATPRQQLSINLRQLRWLALWRCEHHGWRLHDWCPQHGLTVLLSRLRFQCLQR